MRKLLTMITAMITTIAAATDPVDSLKLPYGGTFNGIVGVSGGIPFRQTVSSLLDTNATMAQINTALSSAASNTVVLLTNGTFSSLGNNHLNIAKNGVTLRGATNANGTAATRLIFAATFQVQVWNNTWDYDDPAGFTSITISSGHTRGSSAVVVGSTPTGCEVGALLFITSPAISPTIEGHAGDYANWLPSTLQHPFTSIHEVTSVSGTTINFNPPLNADYISTNTCKVHYRAFSNQIKLSGIENLIITNVSGSFPDHIVKFQGSDQCWAQNCELYGVGNGGNPNAGLWSVTSFRNEYRRNKVAFAAAYSSSEYGMVTFQCANFWVEDNIFFNLPNVWPMVATSGSVFSYNYIYYEQYQTPEFLSQIVFFHGAHDHYNLSEGNWIPTHYNDDTSSGNFSHSRNNVYFRERLRGWDEYPTPGGAKTANIHGLTCNPHHDRLAVAGCVIGTTNQQTQFWGDGNIGNNAQDKGDIFNIGAVTSNTFQHVYNYNIVDNGVHSGEALGGGEALVDSYVYNSKPTWFGDRPWPWVDPANPQYSLPLTSYTNFPAGFRYLMTTNPPAGSQGGGTAGDPHRRPALRGLRVPR